VQNPRKLVGIPIRSLRLAKGILQKLWPMKQASSELIWQRGAGREKYQLENMVKIAKARQFIQIDPPAGKVLRFEVHEPDQSGKSASLNSAMQSCIFLLFR
jgi:hypothetical protein